MSVEIKLLKRHYIFDSIHDAEEAKQILEEYGLNYEYAFEAHFRSLEDEHTTPH